MAQDQLRKLTKEEFETLKAQHARLLEMWPDGEWELRSSPTNLSRIFYEIAPSSTADSIVDCHHQPTAEFLALVLKTFGALLNSVQVD